MCLSTTSGLAQVATPDVLANDVPADSVTEAQLSGLAAVIAANRADIAKPSRQTIGPVIDQIAAEGEDAAAFLTAWEARELGQRESDGAIFKLDRQGDVYALFNPITGEPSGTAPRSDINEIKPNSGVRGLINSALVEFQLNAADPTIRAAALDSLERNSDASQLAPLRASLEQEEDPALLARKQRIERLLTIRFGETAQARVDAINDMGADLSLDLRAALNPITSTTTRAFKGAPTGNIARTLTPGQDIDQTQAYQLLIDAGLQPARLTAADLRRTLEDNISDGQVGGIPVFQLDDPDKRIAAYRALVAQGQAQAAATDADIADRLSGYSFAEIYADPDADVTTAAAMALKTIDMKVAAMQAADLGLDAISLASIYFLAAIGLAITFGVMGVINMAHGEFITMGAYTGYVVQLYITDYTASIIVALPLAFAITFIAGVAMERLVIRHLYKRPLETLLATFGISIALQQLFKNIFGTQARPLTSPSWLDGQWALNDVVSISYIRIAIFVLALIFLALFLYVMKKTRLGLEVRAVTQNPSMAASMGINPDRINMLTFGLGSGIAGIAGVAIGLFAKVTSELGSDYIVQSFMTVVVGGVGNIWGTLAGASLIGVLQKGIEFFNPSNTLAAQTYMILFIIIFIQFRPRGIIALKGRAAGD
ncbi:urea ABC transporter permease subunit UrtB [Thioclava sp. SK-1]|uniref:urea ABC transporter permease subunit UrtB n=1 Tax=Thioclava sp. SK-1 TaxID=1889770 RepID=UPI003519807C